jgi:hypothetical protein
LVLQNISDELGILLFVISDNAKKCKKGVVENLYKFVNVFYCLIVEASDNFFGL